MQILTLHYSNVGPFQNKTVIIQPRAGSYLIQAPIGSGKSILFFDGPIFALYNPKGHRPILNTLSKTGEVAIEFVQDNVQYCIHRKLTKTPKSESVKTKLYFKPFHKKESGGPLFEMSDLKDFVVDDDYQTTDIKNESEIQSYISGLIPYKEVLLATYFLMQDSKNIFELPPAERLDIFKSVFDMLEIDVMKEKIAERKRELSTTVKLRSDMTTYDQKFATLLNTLTSFTPFLTQILGEYGLKTDYHEWLDLVRDEQLLHGKLLLENFRLPRIADQSLIMKHIDQLLTSYYDTHTQFKVLESSQREVQNQHQEVQQKLSSLQHQISALEQQLSSNSTVQLTSLQTTLKQLIQEQESLWTSQEATSFADRIHFLQKTLQSDDMLKSFLSHELSISTLQQAYEFIQQLTERGTAYKHQQELQESHEQHYQKTLKDLEFRATETEQALQKFITSAQDQQQSLQEKLKDCPCAKELLEDQSLQNYDDYLNALKNEHTRALERLQEHQKDHQDPKDTLAQHNLSVLSSVVRDSNRKSLRDRMKTSQELTEKITRLQNDYQDMMGKFQASTELQQQLLSLREQHIELQQQQITLNQRLSDGKQELGVLTLRLKEHKNKQQLQEEQAQVQEFYDLYGRLKDVVEDYKETMLVVKQLKEEEKIASELYTIFSKELLLLVIQTNLPKIQDLMNAYLAQIVEYSLTMDVDRKSLNSDNIELIVRVVDRYGERGVESLSGGQKVILKLVWMIAISFINNSSFLFLDETINNVDADTVASVAEVLNNFVKKKGEQFQFYVVSHDPKIQAMPMRDDVITLTDSSSLAG